MQETNFKVGDKVKVISIPCVSIDNHPEMKGRIYTIQEKCGEQLFINDSLGFVFYAIDLKLVSESRELKGHLWLIVKQSGKVIAGYETREEARMNLSSNYDSRENFKIVKYEFK